MWSRRDNQEVGLEAATLERVRNSSLVKWFRADNVAGLKRTAEAVSLTQIDPHRSVQGCGWVGERRVPGEAPEGSRGGRDTSENAGMSSETRVGNSRAGRPRVP